MLGQNAEASGVADGLCPPIGVQLAKNVGNVGLYCVGRDAKESRNFLVRMAGCQQAKHIGFTCTDPKRALRGLIGDEWLVLARVCKPCPYPEPQSGEQDREHSDIDIGFDQVKRMVDLQPRQQQPYTRKGKTISDGNAKHGLDYTGSALFANIVAP